MPYCLAVKAVAPQEEDIVVTAGGQEALVTNIETAALAEVLGLLHRRHRLGKKTHLYYIAGVLRFEGFRAVYYSLGDIFCI